MKTPYLILLLLLYYSSSFSNSLNTVLSQDFHSKEKILQLKVHPMFGGTPFVIGIVKGNELVGYEHYVAQKGQHAYDLRRIPTYQGHIAFLVTNLPAEAFSGVRLLPASIRDEFDMLLYKDAFSPRMINVAASRHFMGIPLGVLGLLLAAGLFGIGKLVSKKATIIMATAACLIGVAAYDLVTIKGQVDVYQDVEMKYPYLMPIAKTQQFLQEAAPHIRQGSWTFQGHFPDEYHKLYMKYYLADFPFIGKSAEGIPIGTYIVTPEPANAQQKTLIMGTPFNLVQQQ